VATFAVIFSMMRMNVYIDGFNLYYGCLRNSQYKWLDLSSLCRNIFPKHNINRIRYFTALVRSPSDDALKLERQLIFIRALKTIPNLTIHYGHFLSHPREMVLETPSDPNNKTVRVIKTEEKGSDVNLATYLLVDGYENDYEIAVVITNDSDLAEPIKVVRERLNLPVGVINPSLDKKMTSHKLREVASFYWRIKRYQLARSQFPAVMKDKIGSFSKPSRW